MDKLHNLAMILTFCRAQIYIWCI